MAKLRKLSPKNKLNSNTNVSPKNNWTTIQKILGFIELGRPIEWTKPLLNMTIATFIAYYLYLGTIDIGLFITGFFSVAFLWSGLYALNDYTDWKIDLIHSVKKNRPIPSGKVTPTQGKIFSFSLIAISFILAISLNNFLLILCLLCMLTNQLLYTMKPFRLKSRKYFDMISGSMINPIFRYLSGLVLFVSFYRLTTSPFPILPIIFCVGLQFGGYSLYRMFSTEHDKKLLMKSTVALMQKATVQLISHSSIIIGALAYLIILINGITVQDKWLGYLPPQYALAILAVLFPLPLLKDAILSPQKANMQKSYRTTYIALLAFIIINWLIFFLAK